MEKLKHIFIIGCKGLPAKYGGFETFADQLVADKVSKEIKYHVACMANDEGEFEYHEARCFNVPMINIGPAKVIYYDIMAMKMTMEYIEKHQIKDAIIYMLGCTAGPFMFNMWKKMKKLGITFYINPDGHEWKRSKWIYPIQKYLKYSERVLVKHCNQVISDSIGIEKYILKEYAKYQPTSTFIAYGAYLHDEHYAMNKLEQLYEWYKQFDIVNHEYYLIVGRFVPENNYKTMIREFMKSSTRKKLVIITNVSHNKFYQRLKKETHFEKDSRIKFVGTVYDQELLYLIRKNAFAYIHGHEVGGTNPSLLESLATTEINLLLDVDFNKSVGLEGAKYFNKESGNLAMLINHVENDLDEKQIEKMSLNAKQRIKEVYNWPLIINQYEQLFLKGKL